MGPGKCFSPKCGVLRCSPRRGEQRVPKYEKVNAGRGAPPDVPKPVCSPYSRGCPRPPRCLVHTGGCPALGIGLIYGSRKRQRQQLPACGRKGAQAHATAPHAATRGFPHGAAARLEAAPPVPLQGFGEGCLMLILVLGFWFFVFLFFFFFRVKRLI